MIRKINPTDESLIKKLKIKKEIFPETNEIFYIVLLNNNEIGSAVYRTNSKVVDSVGIDKEYKRRGIGTWLYNYIEKDQNIKLVPSKTLMREGELFWRNRLRRNPTDEKLLKEIRIEKINFLHAVRYWIWHNDIFIGYIMIKKGTDFIEDIDLDFPYRRRGLATYLYKYIEDDLNIKLVPSKFQTKKGKAFWEARLNK